MKENKSTEIGRAQSDSTSLTLACRNGLKEREREEEGVSGERQIIEEYNYCGQDKDNGCNPDTA